MIDDQEGRSDLFLAESTHKSVGQGTSENHEPH